MEGVALEDGAPCGGGLHPWEKDLVLVQPLVLLCHHAGSRQAQRSAPIPSHPSHLTSPHQVRMQDLQTLPATRLTSILPGVISVHLVIGSLSGHRDVLL